MKKDKFIPQSERKPLPEHPTKYNGTIYPDKSSGGWKNGKRVMKNCWRAEITIDHVRYRHRSVDRADCEEWLRSVRLGKIKPTNNNADWMRMEQRTDMEVRYDEVIVSAAEEAVLLFDYHMSVYIEPINHYLQTRLLPHMIYYGCRTLSLGEQTAISFAKEAAALLLTRITAGRPVPNFTAACKKMIRLRKDHRDFWYYEKAPKDVKMMVDGLDFSQLAEVYKVARDRRMHR